MNTAIKLLNVDQRATVAAGILVLVTQVILVGSLIRDATAPALIS